MDDVGLRRRLAEELCSAGMIRSEEVDRAFSLVPRHRLVGPFRAWDVDRHTYIDVAFDREHPDAEHLSIVYSDRALVTRQREGLAVSSTSQPSVMAIMLEALQLRPGMRVLEIGAGTGYNAALIAEIVGDQRLVTTIDVESDVVEEARTLLAEAGYGAIDVRHGDGFDGARDRAPFDRIVATVGCPDLAPAWMSQLARDGSILVPLQHAQLHPLVLVDAAARGRFVAWTAFIKASGRGAVSTPWPDATWPTEGSPRQRAGWPGFGSGPEVPGWGRPSDELDFLLFLSLRDPRAFDGVGVGLWEDVTRWAAAKAATILISGDARLADELDALHIEWDELGRPGLEDWELRFARPGAVAEAGFGALEVRRPFFRQLAWPRVRDARDERSRSTKR